MTARGARFDRRGKEDGQYRYVNLGDIHGSGVYNVVAVVLATSHSAAAVAAAAAAAASSSAPDSRGRKDERGGDGFRVTKGGDVMVTLQLVDPTTWAPEPEKREELLAVQRKGDLLVPTRGDDSTKKVSEDTRPAAGPQQEPQQKNQERQKRSQRPASPMNSARGNKRARRAAAKEESDASLSATATRETCIVGDALVANFFAETPEGLPYGSNMSPGVVEQGDVLRIHRLRVERWCDDNGVWKLRGSASRKLGSSWICVSRMTGVPTTNTERPTWSKSDEKRVKGIHFWWEGVVKNMSAQQARELAKYEERATAESKPRGRGKKTSQLQPADLSAIGAGDFGLGAYVDVVAQVVAADLPFPHQGVLWLWDGSGDYDPTVMPALTVSEKAMFDPLQPTGVLRKLIVWSDHPSFALLFGGSLAADWSTNASWVRIKCAQVRYYEHVVELKAVDRTEMEPASEGIPDVAERPKPARKSSQKRTSSPGATTVHPPSPDIPDGTMSLSDLRARCTDNATKGGGTLTCETPVRVQLVSARGALVSFCVALCLECGKTSPIEAGESIQLVCPCGSLLKHYLWDFVLRVRDATAALDVRFQGAAAEEVLGGLPPTNLHLKRASFSKQFVAKRLDELIGSGAWLEAPPILNGLPPTERNAITLLEAKLVTDEA